MTSVPATAWEISPSQPAPMPLGEPGRGCAGVVHLRHESASAPVAPKVFASSGLTKAAQLALLGAPNPYAWNEDAIRSAHLRREILAELVDSWFDGEIYVARSHGWSWNQEAQAFELRVERMRGRAANLIHPLRPVTEAEARVLSEVLMPKLSKHLIAAGFDGVAWQAGKGNPVALSNFLLDGSDGVPRWAWIDLESGVPALAASSPIAFFGFYLPRSFKFGRPLFDDVDTERLRSYVKAGGWDASFVDKVDELAVHQERWKGQRRVDRSIDYRLAKGELSLGLADRYRAEPIRWYLREASRMATRVPEALAQRVRGAARRVAELPWRQLPSSVTAFLLSQRYRARIARRYSERRILAWRHRGQLSRDDANFLRTHLDYEESATFVTDFGIHVALVPFVKGFELWLCPLLHALGFISEAWLAVLVLMAGPAARSVYTGGRIVQSSLKGKERPWTALAVGALPVLGNLAFPIQILRSSRQKRHDLGRFLLYDGLTRIGAHVPIWGGEDTLTEHRFNQLGDRFVGAARFKS